jgi:DNA oxidative demethylase
MSLTIIPDNGIMNRQKAYVDFKHGLFVYLNNDFYSRREADDLYNKLDEKVVFKGNSYVKLYGKKIKIPRKQIGYGDPGTSYSFSGMTVNSLPWIPIISKIKEDVEYVTGLKFNFCLVNRYENGNDYIGYHSDDEKELGDCVHIASVSFGQKRKFYFKNPNTDVVKLSLNTGSLCVMYHPTNKYYKHSVPKETTLTHPRINLTFRLIKYKK